MADPAEVVGQDAPADPTLHAHVAATPAATQAEAALEQADATLDPGAEARGTPEGRSPLAGAAPGALATRFGQRDAAHAGFGGATLVGARVEATVSSQHVGRLSESRLQCELINPMCRLLLAEEVGQLQAVG